MENLIVERNMLPRGVSSLLPRELAFAVELAELEQVEEIRIRSGHRVWVSGGGKNVALDVTVSKSVLEDILVRACGGSLYSCEETIRLGYVTTEDGIRLGVTGEWTEGGVRSPNFLVIRVPRRVRCDVGFVRGLLDSFGMSRGLLAFSPPLGGKTSFLREVARSLSSGEDPLRVVAVDTRGELGFSLDGELCLSLLSHYPRRDGLEIAARTLGAQVVVCDEIGAGEADAIRELHGGGVPLIASAHAADISDLLSRRGIDELHKAGVFGAYIELFRGQAQRYKCYKREDCLDF